MARETNCPACGAPLEYSGDQDEVVCGFCGAKVKVEEESEQAARFQVLDKPAPQSELLSQPVEPKIEPQPDEIKFSFGEPVSYDPSQPDSVGAQVYAGSAAQPVAQVSSVGQPAKPTNWGRWVAIGAGVLILLCGLCACVIAAIAIANGQVTY